MVFGMQWTMAAWCKVNRFPLGSFGYKIGATLQMKRSHWKPAVAGKCVWLLKSLTGTVTVAKNAWKKIGNCHYLPMTSKGLGFHMKTSDHKTRKHTTQHCQTKWTSYVAIDTLASFGGTELLVIAIVCKEVAVAKEWENMGTPSGAASLVKKRVLWSTERKDTVSKAQWSCIDDHTHVVNSDAGFGNVGCQNDLSYSGRWSLKHQPDARWAVAGSCAQITQRYHNYFVKVHESKCLQPILSTQPLCEKERCMMVND